MLRVIPQMIGLENYRTVHSLVSKYIKDDRLRRAFSFEPLLVGGNPFSITSIYLLIHWLERKWGVHFVKGGTTALVEAFARLLSKHQVHIRTRAFVTRIRVVDATVKAVELESGEVIPCDLIVANADPIQVYSRMIAPEFRKKHSARALARKNSRWVSSLFISVRRKCIPSSRTTRFCW